MIDSHATASSTCQVQLEMLIKVAGIVCSVRGEQYQDERKNSSVNIVYRQKQEKGFLLTHPLVKELVMF